MPQGVPTYEEILEQQRQRNNQMRLQQSVETSPLDYDRARKMFYVQGRTGLPSEVIDRDLDNLYEKAKRNEFNYLDYTDQLNGSPIFNEWAASDMYHHAVVERDRRNLTLFERNADSLWRGWNRGDAMIELSRLANKQRDGVLDPGDEEMMEDLRQLVEAGDFGLDGWMSVLVETGVQGNIQTEIVQQSWQHAAAGAVQGAVLSSWGGVTALAGAGIGAGVGWRVGAYEFSRQLEQGLAYDEYIQSGFDPAEAYKVSGLVGVANGALEMIGWTALAKHIPGLKQAGGAMGKTMVERLFKKQTVAGAAQRLVARYGETMGTEIITEILQESITMGGAEYIKSQMREAGDIRPETAPMSFDEWVDSIGEIMVMTMKGTAIIGGIGPGGSFLNDLSRAKQARGRAAFVRALGESAKNSETRQNVPEKYDEYLQAQQEKGPIKAIQFDLDAWVEYWEGQGMDPAKMAKDVGVDLAELQATGADVSISLEQVAKKLAPTDHFQELWKDARLRDGEMTWREAKSFMDNPEEHIERLRAEIGEELGVDINDDFERIKDDITGQLQAQSINFDQAAAEKQAQLMAGVFVTQAVRNPNLDKAPWDLYIERFGGVRADIRDTAASPGAVDLSVDPLLDRIRAGDIPTQRQIFGDSLADFVVKKGGLIDDGGELTARDYRKLRRGLVREGGDTLDGMAEAAAEAGYIPTRDPDLLLEMLDRELQRDDPVFSTLYTDEAAQTLAEDLNRLADYLDMEGINVSEMSNQEIREALANRQTFEQIDTKELNALTEYIMGAVLRAEEDALLGDPYAQGTDEEGKPIGRPDTVIAQLAASLPRVGEQDFGEMEITDRVTVQGKPATRTRKAQRVYEQEVKKRNSLKRLLDCLGGKGK